MRNERVIEGGNLSDAWGKAFLLAFSSGSPLLNLTVGFPVYGEDDSLFNSSQNEICQIRSALDETLTLYQKHSIHTIANTIFPSFWDPERPNDELYTRYMTMWSRLKKHNGNRNGTYFQRMIAYGLEDNVAAEATVNQLKHVIETYMVEGNARRSALSISIMNPFTDHTHQRQRGFPCLQHVHFVPGEKDNSLTITGIYSTQLLLEKAYGNYLGLYRLGRFIAKNMGLKLVRVECNASRVNLFGDKDVSKSKLENLKRFLEKNGV
jgi:thymidylate synthase